jgi:putative phosphoesterase
MMVGVLSDTHDRIPTLQAALDIFQERGLDTVFHPGDICAPFAAKRLANFPGTLHVTFGNNDGERAGLRDILPQIQDGPLHVHVGGRRILLHHALDWCRPEDIAEADIIITGHTHESSFTHRDDKWFLNPGECCGWVAGRATIAVLDLQSTAIEWIEIPT